MSPAGNLSSFIAAIDGGADSVYLGLDKFNARRPAENFAPFIMRKVIRYAHSHNCKVYITLNIQLKPNELSEACSMLQFLSDIGADAVIVTDLAVIDMMRRFFPKLEPHFSTQTVIHNTEEVRLAAELGAKRVVLARELTAEEIAECVKTADECHIEVEIFTEGSMCFCISGRCLMSSFIGGRSGNRGACTGCCRIRWTDETGAGGNLFSMKDLSLAEHLQEIAALGVSALKIEGRLKKSGWVRAVTGIYRSIIDGKADADVSVLHQYTARETGTGHLFGHDHIIGQNENWQNYIKTADDTDIPDEFSDTADVTVTVGDNITIVLGFRGMTETMTESVPPLPKKAKTVSIVILTDKLEEVLSQYETNIVMNETDIQCGLSYINNLSDKVKKRIDKMKSDSDKYPPLTAEQAEFVRQIPCGRARTAQLGGLPTRAIIRETQIGQALPKNIRSVVIYLEPVGAAAGIDDCNRRIAEFSRNHNVRIALPEMMFEHELEYYRGRIAKLTEMGLTQWEANSWGGIMLLRPYNVTKYAGVGLSVMNHKAAGVLHTLGMNGCYAAVEGDVSMFKGLCGFVSLDMELSIVVQGRPPLFISRTETDRLAGKIFKDKYIELTAHRYGDVNYFIADRCLSLVGKPYQADNICADVLAADLRFGAMTAKTDEFNYRRKLV